MPKETPKPFQLLAGHPALDFVNTLDNRFVESGTIELMARYEDLLCFMQQTELLDLSQVRRLARSRGTARLMEQVHELREALARVFYASSKPLRAASLQIVQRFAMQAGAHRRLELGGGRSTDALARWQWEADAANLALPLWVLADAAQALLTSENSQLVRACRRESCQWLFLDASKNHSRRWCDMQVCGNRVKAERYKHAHPA